MARKNNKDRADQLFFQHPFGLEEDARIIKLKKQFGFEGMGIFWEVYRKIRLGKGQYPLDSIILMANGKERKKRKIERILTEFDLFIIDMGMVSMSSGLTIKSFKNKGDSVKTLQSKVDELSTRTYENTLMPEELAEMDSKAKENLKKEIKEKENQEIRNTDDILDFV